MRAVRVVRHGSPSEAIEIDDIAVPEPGPGQVRVRVAAASLNFGDVARCRGGVNASMAVPPFTLGMDVAGVVDATGEGMEQWVGQRVVAITPQAVGGLAEHALCSTVFAAPPSCDDIEAAAFTVPFHVGWLALHERARLTAGETVLVRGGASAVGTAAIQLAVAAGARVVALAGGPDKVKLCLDLGAEVVLDTSAGGEAEGAAVFDAVMDSTADRGADVVFDPIGGDLTETLWTCGTLGGRYLAVGFNDDPESGLTGRPLRTLSMANMTVMGVLLAYLETPRDFRRLGINAFPPETGQRAHAALLALAAEGRIRPVVGRTVGFEGVAAALEDHADRRTSGRTVVTP